MVEPIRIVFILFALFALSRAILRYKEKLISAKEFYFWSLLWIGGAIAIAVPGTISIISEATGIGRPADLVLYIAVILLFYLNFRAYVQIDKLQQDVTKITREVAIKRVKKKR